MDKGKMYTRFVDEYHKLDNAIGLVKMNNFDLTLEDRKKIEQLEKKKTYIMSRVEELQRGL